MRARDLDQRPLTYAARIAVLAGALPENPGARHIANQLLRAGTSAGANYQEAQAGESRADFIHKLQIALKEVRESTYWLRLIAEAKLLPAGRLAEILDESQQLTAILSKSVATAKGTSK